MSRRALSSLLVVLGLMIAGLGLAQPGDDSGGDEGGDVEITQRADLSGPEQIAEADRIQRHGTQISRRIASMLDEARREGDIIRVTCLNDKLTQVNANLRTVDQRLGSLREAVDGNDTGRRNHEYTVLTVLGQKFNVLEQEANQCIGQDIFETGATRVTTTIDPDTPDEDPTVLQPPEVDVPFIPPPASPTI